MPRFLTAWIEARSAFGKVVLAPLLDEAPATTMHEQAGDSGRPAVACVALVMYAQSVPRDPTDRRKDVVS